MRNHTIARWAGLLVALVLMPLASCNEILEVNNPEEIGVDQLSDPQLLNAQVAGVRALLAESVAGEEAGLVQAPNFLTDETVTGLNWEDWARVNQRIVRYFEGPPDPTWSNLSELIRNGQTALQWLDELSPNPSSDARVALVSALTGYGFVFIGETMCEAVFSTPEDLGTTVHSPPEVFPMAIPFFERALTVGAAAGADDLVNLARVGLARAYLNLGNFGQVVTYASAVPSGFQWWINYSDERAALNNNLYNEVHGANHTIGVHPNFLQGTFDEQDIIDTQTDPRIQHATRWTTGHNGSTHLYKPYQGLRFSGYTGETLAPPSAACPGCTGATEGSGDDGDVLLYQRDTDVLLADYLEAQHHMHEAMMRQGGNDAAVNAFVNARRTVGNEGPVSLGGDALFAELRRQRSRDFYMGGLRLGDLRRWKRDGVGDFFPTGPHPNPTFAPYGPWTCLPLPLEEYEGNPNLQRPANPDVPPGI